MKANFITKSIFIFIACTFCLNLNAQQPILKTQKIEKIIKKNDFQVKPKKVSLVAQKAIQRGVNPGAFQNVTYSYNENVTILSPQTKTKVLNTISDNSTIETKNNDLDPSKIYIDEDSDLLKLYQMQLSTWETPRAKVYLAHDGYDAMLQIGANKPDVIIVDSSLPLVDSEHIVRLIRQKPDFSHCRIIIVSSTNEGAKQFNSTLPDDVLIEEKPIAFSRIEQLVSEHLEDKQGKAVQ